MKIFIEKDISFSLLKLKKKHFFLPFLEILSEKNYLGLLVNIYDNVTFRFWKIHCEINYFWVFNELFRTFENYLQIAIAYKEIKLKKNRNFIFSPKSRKLYKTIQAKWTQIRTM